MKTLSSFALAAAVSLVGAQTAHAYDFKIGNQINGQTINYVSVHTVSSLCHDRTPIDLNAGDPPLGFQGYVSGSTAPGCLIDQVDIYPSWFSPKTWSNPVGNAGGTYTLMPSAYEGAYVCPDDLNCNRP